MIRSRAVAHEAECAGVSGQGALGAGDADSLEVTVDVKDNGMMVVTTATPDFRWQHGTADINLRWACPASVADGRCPFDTHSPTPLMESMPPSVHSSRCTGCICLSACNCLSVCSWPRRVHGRLDAPLVEGAAHVSRATIVCPILKYPITNAGATVHFEDGCLRVEALEARVGRRGYIGVRGALPTAPLPRHRPADRQIAAPDRQAAAAERQADRGAERAAYGIGVDIQGLELRARNAYQGAIWVDRMKEVRNSDRERKTNSQSVKMRGEECTQSDRGAVGWRDRQTHLRAPPAPGLLASERDRQTGREAQGRRGLSASHALQGPERKGNLAAAWEGATRRSLRTTSARKQSK
jgi:hypothetical protein